jgi:two-component system phosphate regulon response regulator PhoB
MASPKLLVVDDEPYLTELVAQSLERAGYSVFVANDGEEGFEAACRESPDLIVTDYQMPVTDGFSLACRLKETGQTANVPLIMLTARGHRLSPTDLARTNIKQMLAKPFSARQLKALIEELVPIAPSAAAA